MKATYWNARSVVNKTVSLYEYLSDNSCDILIITETWLRKAEGKLDHNKVTLRNLIPDSFEIKHTPRPDGRPGGGVAIIYSDAINGKVQNCFTQKTYKQFESMSVLMNLKNTSFCLSVVYRPPPTRKNNLKLKCFWKDWTEYLNMHISSNFEFIIVGDVNLHLDVRDNANTLKFNNLMDEFNLKQHIHQQTHTHGHTLDVLITRSNSDIASQIFVFDPPFSTDDGQPINDHYAIKWCMQGTRKKVMPGKFTMREWKKIDHELFAEDLRNRLSQCTPTSMDLVKTYNEVLIAVKEDHAPLKEKHKKRKLNPWYTNELKVMKSKRRQLERLSKKSGLESDKYNLRQYCYAYERCLRKTVLSYNKNLISEAGKDSKKLHSVANKLLGNKTRPKYPEAKSHKELADSFMKFFINKIKLIRDELPVGNTSTIPQNVSVPKLSTFSLATDSEILTLVESMKSKTCLLDPVPTWVVKKHLKSLIPVIKEIANQSLETGTVHPSLKSAIIRPILKSPDLDHKEFKNFRPVSNLPFLAKVLEKIVYARLINHLTTNRLLPTNQSAYKKFHSTETAMLKIQNDILTFLDEDKIVALVKLDISAAFDTVDHQRLLECFSSVYGLSGTVLKWLESYLSDRTQRVRVEDFDSFIALLEYGFPQGAVLAGLLYNMYSGPLHTELNKHPVDHHGYADDKSAYIAFTVENKDAALISLQHCLTSAKEWLDSNLLQVNDGKSQAIYFTPKKELGFVKTPILFESSLIEPENCVEYLGIQFDALLNLERHINKTTSTAYFHLKNITKIRKYLDIDSTKSLVQSVVISRIDYCNSLLYRVPQRVTNKLQRVQNHAARVICKKKKRDHITPVLKELHWLPVRSRINFKILLLTYKCLAGKAPEYLCNLLNCYRAPRTLRSNTLLAGTLVLQRFKRLKHGGRSFSSAAPILWNCLPVEIRNANTVESFKSLLKTHLFREYYLH